jgi:redox-sensitive bicupin YhaK (pirin superfamily)
VHGDHLHGIQAWVALPTEHEETAPSLSHHAGKGLPQWNDAGVNGQLIAGSAYGLTAAAETYSALFYAHLNMEPGATAEIPGGHKERALYIATGAVELHGTRYEAGRMLVLSAAASRVRALEHSAVMVLGGEPVGERFLYWNFVSSSKDRLAQATSDWRAGKMKLPDADHAEFIPLPDQAAPPPPAMS